LPVSIISVPTGLIEQLTNGGESGGEAGVRDGDAPATEDFLLAQALVEGQK
jgi:hypothetical protein